MAWYQEMLGLLKERWQEGLGWTECESLCVELTSPWTSIVQERGIKPPKHRCPNCQPTTR